MHLGRRIVVSAGSALVAAAAALSFTAGAVASDVVGHVYVNDNTAGINTIAAFDRHVDGTLTPLAGSPFAAGGAGTGSIVGSQGALQVTSDGRYLLAVDAGSNQISVLRVRPDGSLREVEGSPVWSGGIEPISVAVSGGLVYVANEGSKTTGTGSKRGRAPRGHQRVDVRAAKHGQPGRHPVQLDRRQPGRSRGRHRRSQHLPHRQLHARIRRAPDTCRRLPIRCAGRRAVRQRVLAGEPVTPLRLQRPRGKRQRIGFGIQRLRGRRAQPNRWVAIPRQPDGSMLGRDHARRELPLHGEHRQHKHLDLPDRGERLAALGGQHAVQERGRNPAVRRSARPPRQRPLRRRRAGQRHQRVCGHGRRLERAERLAIRAPQGRDAFRHRRHLDTFRKIRGAGTAPAPPFMVRD
ncbi:MAG: lactonase family protein [Chloroflexi bacterium]|nr:MAG: lactonase family protein [Chloroflexota bacterium]